MATFDYDSQSLLQEMAEEEMEDSPHPPSNSHHEAASLAVEQTQRSDPETTVNVFIIGQTGAGKSALTRGLLSEEVCPDSDNKVQKYGVTVEIHDTVGLVGDDDRGNKAKLLKLARSKRQDLHLVVFCIPVDKKSDLHTLVSRVLYKKPPVRKYGSTAYLPSPSATWYGTDLSIIDNQLRQSMNTQNTSKTAQK